MADVVDSVTRSRMMSGIRGKNTKPEMQIRRSLHAAGYRYRLHGNLPGKPDLVFPARKAVLFVNGCFWHGHDCHLFRLPATRPEFWKAKIRGNAERDRKAVTALRNSGWRVGTVWECTLKGKARRPTAEVVDILVKWLREDAPSLEIEGYRSD